MELLLSTIVNATTGMRQGFAAVLDVWFIVFPPIFYWAFRLLWEDYVQSKFASGIKWVLLEIIPPRDIEKSPLPMESIFAGFAGVIKSPTAIEEYIKGEFPVKFSLEIVSTEGKVHFYIRTQVQFRNLVEAHFYAQYPDVEIVEVPDYVNTVPRTLPNKDWDLWGTDFSLTKDDLYPIRTYKYFEESVTGKMIDPLAGLIETMGKIGPGQHIWLQFITTPVAEKWNSTDEARAPINKIMGIEKKKEMGIFQRVLWDVWDIFRNVGRGLFAQDPEWMSFEEEKKQEQPLEFRLSPGQKDILKALEANIGKQMYKVRMRQVYIGRRSVFNKALGVSAFMGAIKQFSDQNMNGFKPNDNSKTYANYIFTQERLRYRQRRIFNRFISRDGTPSGTQFILSSEEMATVFHIPDMAVVAPSLARVTAKRGSAPANLPVQID